VDKFLGQALPSPTIARTEDEIRNIDRNKLLRDNGSTVVGDPYHLERLQRAGTTMRVVRSVGEWFGGVRGRKRTMVLISEGIDYDLTAVAGPLGRDGAKAAASAAAIHEEIRRSMITTARSNVVVYAVDPRGLPTSGDDTFSIGALPRDARASTLNPQELTADLRRAHDNLRNLTRETGGFAALNRNDFTNAFERIVRDNSSYYVLAYYPPNPKRDGKFHQIEVRTKRPGLTVRARRGYTAPSASPAAPRVLANPGASAPTVEALNSPLPLSALPMRVYAAPFKGAGSAASVLLGVELLPGRGLPPDKGMLELSFVALDANGKVHSGRTDRITLKLGSENKARVERSGLRALNRLSIAAGRYQLRVATHDVKGGVVGSVLYDLEVPDYDAKRLNMSGLALASASSAAMLVARNDEQLQKVLLTSPTGQRTFSSSEELVVFAEVYDGDGGAPHKVHVMSTVTSANGAVVFKAEEERESTELQAGDSRFEHVVRIPLAGVPEGRYLLTVEAETSLSGSEPVRREVPIRVVQPPSVER
jgi:VWFA-related protein